MQLQDLTLVPLSQRMHHLKWFLMLCCCYFGSWGCSESGSQAQPTAHAELDTQRDSEGSPDISDAALATQTSEDAAQTDAGDSSACEGVEPCEVNMVIGDQRFQCALVESDETRRVWSCVEVGSGAESEWVCVLNGASGEEASWTCESRDTSSLLLEWKCVDPKRTDGNGETNWTCNPDQGCSETTPQIGEWTPPFEGGPCVECSYTESHFADCRHLFVGRIDGVNGNNANLSFEKTMNAGPPSVVIRWWVLAVPMQDPTCQPFDVLALADLEVRAEGYWSPTERVLSIQDVPIWATQEAYETALPGDQVHLFLITGGRDGPDVPTWITKDALSFTKLEVCE